LSYTRSAATILAEGLAKALAALERGYGDLSKNPASLLTMEATLDRLRGSSTFTNDDVTTVFNPPQLTENLQFSQDDRVGLGIVGSQIAMDPTTALAFPTPSPWNPTASPPCSEGWGILDYSAWASYNIASPSGNSEDGHYASRLTYTYPVKYLGSGAYTRVGFWERARFITFQNTTGVTKSGNCSVSVTFTDDQLQGMQLRKPTGEPIDVRVFSNVALFQTYTSNTWGSFGGVSSALDLLSMQWSSPSAGSWTLTLNMPSTYTWTSGSYWHVIFYWGTKDAFALSANPEGSFVSNTVLACPATIFSPKSFFRKDINDSIDWQTLGVVDGGNGYLIAQDRTHFAFYDAQYSTPTAPARYALQDLPYNSKVQIAKSLGGYVEFLKHGWAMPLIIQGRTSGQDYESPITTLSVKLGPPLAPEFFPVDWDTSPYFPVPDADNVQLARVVLKRPAPAAYGTVEARGFTFLGDSGEIHSNTFEQTSWYANVAIAWMCQDVLTFGALQAPSLATASFILPNLINAAKRVRSYLSSNPVVAAAFPLLTKAFGQPTQLATDKLSLADPTNIDSIVFLGLIKDPLDTAMLPDEGAVYLSDEAVKLIDELAGAPATVEMLQLNSDYLGSSGRKLPSPQTFELYFEASDQCTIIDPSYSGTGLAKDYTIRLVLEDEQENLYYKDWYVMASSYLITQGQWNTLVATGQPTDGYFTRATLSNIPEYAMFGSAGVVPDLFMGNAQVLTMREEVNISTDQDTGVETVTIGPNAYPNLFTGLRSSAICVANYSFFDVSYWVNNLFSFFGETRAEEGGDQGAQTPQDARADSFSIAPSGLACGALEMDGNAAATISDTGIATATSGGVDRTVLAQTIAFRLVPTANETVSGFSLRFKLAGESTTTSIAGAGCDAFLYTDDDGALGTMLVPGGHVDYLAMGVNTFVSVQVPLNYSFQEGLALWLVLQKNTEPINQVMVVDFDATGKSSPTLLASPSASTWIVPGGTAWATASGTGGSTLTAPYNPTSVATFDEPISYLSTAVQVTLTGSTNTLNVRLRADGTLTNPVADNLSFALFTNSSAQPGTVVSQAGTISYSSLATTFGPKALTLSTTVPSGVYWLVITPSTAPLGGRVCIEKTGSPGAVTEIIYTSDGLIRAELGQPYITWYAVPTALYGAFNRSTTAVATSLPGPFTQRNYIAPGVQSATYQVESWWSWTGDPFPQAVQLSLYPRAFYYSGSWRYANFSNEAFVVARLLIDGQIEDVMVTVPQAPGWSARFWAQTANTVQVINTNEPPAFSETVDQIDLVNFTNSGSLGQYFNADFTGTFTPHYNEAYTLRVQGSTGFRVYLNGTLIIDNLINPVGTEIDYTTAVLNNTLDYEFEVQFYSSNSGGGDLTVKWQSATQSLGFLGSPTALTPSPAPISLGSSLVSGIVYLGVGKTSAELNTYTDGAPPGDILTLRSS
jgi:hypothetical protein